MNSIKIEINKITRNHIILKSSNNLIKSSNHVKKKITSPTKSCGKTTTTKASLKKKVIFADELGLKLVEIRSFSTNHDNFFSNGDWSFYNSLNFNFDYDDGVCEEVEDYADDDDKGIEILTDFNNLLTFNEIKNLQIHNGENGDQVLIEVKDVIPENYQYYFIPDNCAESEGRKIYNKIKVRRDFNKEVSCDGSPIVQLEQLNLSSQLPQQGQGNEPDGQLPNGTTESSNLNGIIKVTKYISSANKPTLLSLLERLEKCEKNHLKVLEARLINTENKIQIRFIAGENQECNTSSTEVFARWTKNNWSSQQDVKSIYKESLLEIGVKSNAQQYSSGHIMDVMDDQIKSTISLIFQKHNKDILNNLSFTCNFIENDNHFIKSLDFNSVICEDHFEFQIPFLQLTSSTETEDSSNNTNSYDTFSNSKLYNLYNDRTEVVPLKLALCFKNSAHEIWDNNYGKDYSTAISITYTNNNNNNNNKVENTINFNNGSDGGGGNSHFDNNYNNSYDNFYENMSMAYY